MPSTNHIEKLLSETPAPRLRDGPHRVALKRELLSQMPAGENPMPKPWRRIVLPTWIPVAAAAALVAVIVAIFVARQMAGRSTGPRSGPAYVAAPASPDK